MYIYIFQFRFIFFSAVAVAAVEKRDNEVNEKWLTNLDQLRDAINLGISNAIEATSTCEQQLCDKLKTIKVTAIEKEIKKGLGM